MVESNFRFFIFLYFGLVICAPNLVNYLQQETKNAFNFSIRKKMLLKLNPAKIEYFDIL